VRRVRSSLESPSKEWTSPSSSMIRKSSSWLFSNPEMPDGEAEPQAAGLAAGAERKARLDADAAAVVERTRRAVERDVRVADRDVELLAAHVRAGGAGKAQACDNDRAEGAQTVAVHTLLLRIKMRRVYGANGQTP
jgi:hypothetical protein